jgi:cyclopropane fatty-acyl-phospholipid synthase-like methyltransferase
MDKPYSESCDQNKAPILAVLAPLLRDAKRVLEIGSGTGQHAVHFAAALPGLTWQASDIPAHLPGIRQWIDEAALPNLPPPLALDVTGPWPDWADGAAVPFDAVFSANTAHIMGMPEVEAMFEGVGRLLAPGRPFALYGPFAYGGRHTSASNARFDAWLRARDPRMGVRDRHDLDPIAARCGLIAEADLPMPVNNRTLVYRKVEPGMA